MIYVKKPLDKNICVVYGFRGDNPGFAVTLTLQKEGDKTEVHGFNSNVHLTFRELWQLREYLLKEIETPFIVMEAVPGHARVYNRFFNVVKSYRSKTFTGYDCVVIKARTDTRINKI